MAKHAREEGEVHAVTHAEDCSGCEEFAGVHEQYRSCALCGLAHKKDEFAHEDVVSLKPVCVSCWDKCAGDPIEVARQISGKSASLDHDHGRILSISNAA